MRQLKLGTVVTDHNLKAYLLLGFTTWCWGANAIFGRVAVGEISPMLLVTLRWLCVLILLMIFARKHLVRDWPVLRHHLLFVCLMGTIGFTAFNALFYVAAHSTSAINIGILQGSIPVFVLLGTFFIHRSKISYLQTLGVAGTLFGVMIVASGGELAQLRGLSINRGDFIMLLACFFYAVYSIGLSKRPPVSALGLFTAMAIVAFIVSLPLLALEINSHGFTPPTPRGWIVVALIALLPSFIAQIFFIHSVGLIGPARAGVFVNLVPVFAAVMAVLYLQEAFEIYHAVSLGLVLGGIWLSELGKVK
jgi:drug/metabolite transporter (DMT)-like permease